MKMCSCGFRNGSSFLKCRFQILLRKNCSHLSIYSTIKLHKTVKIIAELYFKKYLFYNITNIFLIKLIYLQKSQVISNTLVN